MNQTNLCLSDDDLYKLQRNELSNGQVAAMEAHVNQCSRCAEVLDSIHQDPQWISDIHPVLQETYKDLPTSADGEGLGSHESVLKLLSPSEDPAMLGRVGGYEVVGVIGQGGMGVVFKAFDTALNRFVAIKMLLPHLTANGAARKRFMREAQAAAAVVDDHVLPIFGVDEWQGTPYLVMQYSRGTTLQKRIQQQGPLSIKETLRIGLQTARGLAAAHAQGLVHRDVKPANILLDVSVERAVLMDFGLARAADDASVTRTGIISGTPMYMSPEQVRADSVDARSDLFSLGSTLYAMCAGWPPFRSHSHNESAYGVMHRITHEEPRPICEVNSDVPAWMGLLIERLMSKDPDGRFESAGEVADLLENCLAHVQQPTQTSLPEAVVPIAKANGGSSWRRWLIAASLAAFFAFTGVLLVLEMNKGKLIVECSADDVPIRVMQGDTEVKKLTVSKEGAVIRVAAGKYRVEVEGNDIDRFEIENETVLLSRRGSEVVNIRWANSESNGIPVIPPTIRLPESIPSSDNVADLTGEPATSELIPDFHGISESLEAAYLRHFGSITRLQTWGFFGAVPMVIQTTHGAKSKGSRSELKLVVFSDGKVITSSGGRVFSDQLSQAELDTLLEEISVNGLATLDHDLSKVPTDTHKDHRLPDALKYVLEPVENRRESIEFWGQGDFHFVLQPVDSTLGVFGQSDIGNAPAEFKAARRVLDQLASQTVAGGKDSIETYIRYANKCMSAQYPDAPPFDDNATVSVSMNSIRDGSLRKRIEIFSRTKHEDYQTFEYARLVQAADKSLTVENMLRDQKVDDDKGFGRSTPDRQWLRFATDDSHRREPSLAGNDSKFGNEMEVDVDKETPLRIATKVLRRNRSRLASLQIRYCGLTESGKNLADTTSLGFSGVKVSYWRPTSLQGWTYDGHKMQSANRETENGGLTFADCDTDFSRQFCGSRTPLQVAGYLGLSERTVPYLDEIIESDPSASASWVIREKEEDYSNVRPWEPQSDRMLRVEFEYPIPILPETDSGKPFSAFSPLKTTFIFDPKKDYCVVWHRTESTLGYHKSSQVWKVDSFRTFYLKINGEKHLTYFPQTMFLDHENSITHQTVDERTANGVEVLDLTIGESFDARKFYSTRRPLVPVESLTGLRNSTLHLKTVDDAEARVRELTRRHKEIANAEIEYTVWSSDDNGNTLPNRFHVWLDGQNGRRDHGEAIEIQTEEYSFYRDANENRTGKGDQRFTRNTIPTLERMVGLYLPDAVVSTYDLEHHLLPENRKNVTVELGQMDGQPVTIVKFDRELPNDDQGWTQYVLSPAQGNCPIAITHSRSSRSGEKPTYSDSTQVSWQTYGDIWFPKTIRNSLHSEVDARDERDEIKIERARFNADPFPDVFDPEKLVDSSRPKDGIASPPQLKTIEQAEARVQRLIQQRKEMLSAEVQYVVRETRHGEERMPVRYHVWLNGRNSRCDRGGATEIQTEDYSYYAEGKRKEFGRGDRKFSLNTIPEIARMGLSIPRAAGPDHQLGDHLLPKNRKNVRVEMGMHAGKPITIVKFDLKLEKADEGWGEYWLSPAQGNCPIYIANGWTYRGDGNKKYANRAFLNWLQHGDVWFPETIKANRTEAGHEVESQDTQIELARFNAPMPNVFDPDKLFTPREVAIGDANRSIEINKSESQLTTIEEVEAHLRMLFEQRQQIKNADVEFTLTGSGSYEYLRRYHVWKDGYKLRADARGPASDGQMDQRSIITPDFVSFNDFESGHSEFSVRSGGPVTGNASVPELAKFGFINWNVESLGSHDLEEAFFGENHMATEVSTMVRDGQPLTVVQFTRIFNDGREGWGEYWLSPAQGNHPVYLLSGLKVRGTEQTEIVIEQKVVWRQYDNVWFPKRIDRKYRKQEQRPDIESVVVHKASFNRPSFPDVFDPTKIDIGKPAAEPKPQAKNSPVKSPQQVFEHLVRMERLRDWSAAMHCMTEECRDELVAEKLMAIGLIQSFSMIVDDDEDTTAPKFRAQRFMENLEKQFPNIAWSKEKQSLEIRQKVETITKQLTSAVPSERREARINLVRTTVGKDSDELYAALSDFLRDLTEDAKQSSDELRLEDLNILDDKAFAVVVDSDGERTPIAFRKVAGQWKLDKLVSNSAFDLMSGIEQSVHAINAANEESGKAAEEEYFFKLSKLPAEDESIEDAFQNHVKRKGASLYPDSPDIAPMIVLCSHSAKHRGNAQLKLAIFNDGRVIAEMQDRVFSDQLSKVEIDAVFGLVKQQKLYQFREDLANLKMPVTELTQPKLLPLALKVTIPPTKKYQESMEFASMGEPVLVIAQVEQRTVGYSSVKSEKEQAFVNVRNQLLRISNRVIAGGKDAVESYRFLANEQLKKKHPSVKPFDENDWLAAFLVKNEDGAWQKRIEFIRKQPGNKYVQTVVSVTHQPDSQPSVPKVIHQDIE